MEPTVNFQTLFNALVGICGVLVGWVLNSLRDALHTLQKTDKELTTKVQQVELLVADAYVKKSDMDKHLDALFAHLRRIEDKLDGKADK